MLNYTSSMFYYFVWVRSNRYHGSEALTYFSPKRLRVGQIVEVELQNQNVLGVVTGLTTEPRFQTKEIVRILDIPALPAHMLRLVNWLKDYYPASLGIITQQLIPAGFSDKQLAADSKSKFKKPDLSKLPPLTKEQKQALEQMQEQNTYILHGVTGSGKTRVYIELTARVVNEGRSAIILTPEISLTSQLANNFRQVFDERVVLIHSAQTPAQRQRAWLDTLLAKEPVIVIGPRSALFSPIAKPGLIVLDESHETAYKQEQAPHYQAGRVAAYLAQITRSSLILGSATPSVVDYYLAKQKSKPIIKMKHLARSDLHKAAKITVVDRRDHSLFTKSPSISNELIQAVEKALANKEQSLLYLNRRGTARMVLCQNCGWQAICPNCDVPLIYHGDKHQLRCHSCNYFADPPTSCPKCDHTEIIFRTAGTKAIVSELEKLFPKVKIGRFDTDNPKAERFEEHYESIKAGDVDILVGTQMLAKGLDLPRLSTLGVLMADTSLYLPDFSAQERSYQLLSQVLGRIGRGHITGRAVIQTYHSDHSLLKDAITNNYEGFLKNELEERQKYLFPPFCYLLKLSVRRAGLRAAESAAAQLKNYIQTAGYQVRVEGPAPSFYERFKNKYQWQLIVKATNRNELLKIIAKLPANWSYDIDPIDLL